MRAGNAKLPKMVFTDMDGTFVATDKSVPRKNLRILDALASLGIPFVPCTGRPVSAVPHKILMHRAARYAVGANGAVIQDVNTGQRLHVEGIRKSAVLELYERVRELNTTFDVFADGEVFAERWRYEAMGSYGIDEPTLDMLRKVRQPVDLNVPELVQRAHAVEKITCFWKSESDCAGLSKAIEGIPGLCSSHGHPRNFELQAKGVSKGFALEWLCEHTGISTSAVVAFGDESNDIPLLEAAGMGVAMQNAIPEVQAVADATTTSNDDAGVARFLERVL